MLSTATALAALLVFMLIANLFRVVIGPRDGDRLLAAQLIGTFGTAIALVVSIVNGAPALVDVALVLSSLAAVTGIVYSHLEELGGEGGG